MAARLKVYACSVIAPCREKETSYQNATTVEELVKRLTSSKSLNELWGACQAGMVRAGDVAEVGTFQSLKNWWNGVVPMTDANYKELVEALVLSNLMTDGFKVGFQLTDPSITPACREGLAPKIAAQVEASRPIRHANYPMMYYYTGSGAISLFKTEKALTPDDYQFCTENENRTAKPAQAKSDFDLHQKLSLEQVMSLRKSFRIPASVVAESATSCSAIVDIGNFEKSEVAREILTTSCQLDFMTKANRVSYSELGTSLMEVAEVCLNKDLKPAYLTFQSQSNGAQKAENSVTQ